MVLSGYNNVLLYLNKLIMCLYTLRCFFPNKTKCYYKDKTFEINSNAFANV